MKATLPQRLKPFLILLSFCGATEVAPFKTNALLFFATFAALLCAKMSRRAQRKPNYVGTGNCRCVVNGTRYSIIFKLFEMNWLDKP